jgi:hypothetical protein
MGYYNNAHDRSRIDRLLWLNATIQANLKMKTPLDVGSRESAQKLWLQLLIDIRNIDEEFYESLASHEEKRLVTQKLYNKTSAGVGKEASV